MNQIKALVQTGLSLSLVSGLLALSLFTQPAQSAPKTYDAVQLAEYEACLNLGNIQYPKYVSAAQITKSVPIFATEIKSACFRFRPIGE